MADQQRRVPRGDAAPARRGLAARAQRLRAMVGPALDAVQTRLDDPRTSLRAASILLRFAVPRPAGAAQRDEQFDDELEEDLKDLDFGEPDDDADEDDDDGDDDS